MDGRPDLLGAALLVTTIKRIIPPRAARSTTIDVSQGAAALTIEVPAGVAVRLRSKTGLGSVNVDQSRFPAVAGG